MRKKHHLLFRVYLLILCFMSIADLDSTVIKNYTTFCETIVKSAIKYQNTIFISIQKILIYPL